MADRVRRRRRLKRYVETDGCWVKRDNVCEWDLDERGSPLRFDSKEAVLEHEDENGRRRQRGEYPLGGYAVVPEGQAALAQNINQHTQVAAERVVDCVERAEHGLHARFDGLEADVNRLLEYHEKAPPSTAPDDLQLMARILKEVKVGRMNAILKDLRIPRPRGLKKEDKATLIVDTMPRDQLLRFLAGPTQEPRRASGSAHC